MRALSEFQDRPRMLRSRLSEALKDAVLAKDRRSSSTIRLILAAVKDRDITLRGSGGGDVISDDDILGLLQTMVRQRHESIELFEKGQRKDLADRERAEIDVVLRFMPEQMDDEAIASATKQVVEDLEATGLKDMGRVMGKLKSKYTGQMDFSKASSVAKELLV
jgi:uncharacterized protein YqeY